MSVRIDSGSRKTMVRIKNLNKLTRQGIRFAGYTSGKGLVKATSAEILRKPKGGRIYLTRVSSGRRRRHTASAAGETHANFSGTLRRSLGFKVNTTQMEFGYGVDRNDAPDYASFVEDGTSKMGPRPSLENGINSQRRNFQSNFDREIGKRMGLRV